jgi:aryl-alcohol dehydrogenase-like predicted oxidoreductase
MRQRPLGRTGISCSELSLGTWGLSGDGYGELPAGEAERVILRSRALGINSFETASSYAGGAMEEQLGRLLGHDHRTILITRIGVQRSPEPRRKRFDIEWLDTELDLSAKRLHRDRPDLVLLHNPIKLESETTQWMEEQTKKGRIRSWGVSVGSLDVAREAIRLGAPVIQLAYNPLWHQDFEALREEIQSHEVGVLARSVLAHGLLCGYWPPDRVFTPGDHRCERWTGDELRRRLRQLDILRPLVSGTVPTLRAAALRWVLHQEQVSSAVLGPRSVLQLDQLVREAGTVPYLPSDVVATVQQRLEEMNVSSS